VRREQEGEARALEAGARRVLVERQRQAERLQHVGAAAARGDRAVAVLGDAHAAGRREERRARRQVEAVRAIPTRAYHIGDRRAGGDAGPARQRAHRERESTHLRRGRPLDAKRGEQRARHRRRHRGSVRETISS
jgi:hypothetical protein